MLFSQLHNGTKSGKKIFLTETVFFSQQLSFKIHSVDPDASCGVTLTWEQHGTPCTAAPVKLNFWHIECSLPLNTMSPLTFFPPLFSTAASFHRRKLNPLEGKSLLVGKGCSFAPMCRKQRECGAVWLSNDYLCWGAAQQDDTTQSRSVYVKLQVLKVSQSLT